jgi:hypothetical protein
MDFRKVIESIVKEFSDQQIDFALVGGLAVSLYVQPRTTMDVDILLLSNDVKKAKKVFLEMGYKVVFESSDIVTFVSSKVGLGRVDVQLAHRAPSVEMLNRANVIDLFPKIKIKVLKPMDIIGLKVQAYNNDPSRYHKDMADIQELAKLVSKKDLVVVQNYFKMFSKEKDFEAIFGAKK